MPDTGIMSTTVSQQKSILVLVEDYPNNNGGVSMMFVHTRNLFYKENGIKVRVLSFQAKSKYIYEGIEVFPEKDYDREEHFDLLLLHAANIKHHYVFLRKNAHRFSKLVFFFHGHEVLKTNRVYPQPYYYVSRNKAKEQLQDCYDSLKLAIWRQYLPKLADKSWFIFVSRWMKEEFYKWTGISPDVIEGHSRVIYNGVGQLFEDNHYDDKSDKEFDFVTIRSNLDGSKYALDLVNEWAGNTLDGRFLVIGKGSFFSYYDKADNIVWLDRTLNHTEILSYLNKSKYALMPTRTDAQGLMMCEMAAFGIPVITSDIPVCHEVFDGFHNAFFVPNEEDYSLEKLLHMKTGCLKDSRFFRKKTLEEECRMLFALLEGRKEEKGQE